MWCGLLRGITACIPAQGRHANSAVQVCVPAPPFTKQVPSASRKQLRQLLALPGLDVNARGPNGRTPTMLAVERGQPGILSDLLATGRVDLAARDNVTGANALLLAARSADAAVLRILLDAGAGGGWGACWVGLLCHGEVRPPSRVPHPRAQ